MPILIALVLIAGAFFFMVVSIPLAMLLRYRQGTRRRRARLWIATINLFAIATSTLSFLITAGVVNRWVPDAFVYSAAGLLTGCVLGLIGLALTRWESDLQSLYYTPNRPLVIAVSLIVAVRLAFGFWRGWQVWQTNPDQTSWLAAIGVAGSMAAGGVVLGYYLVYWAGLRMRVKRVITGGYSGRVRRM